MKVLVYGSGGREHALSWKLAQSPSISEVLVTPGNPGIALEPKIRCLPAADFPALAALCRAERVDFVVVGPDQALADGLVDFLDREGIPAFGPVQAAARIEWSKAFSKELMQAEGIPTARFEIFSDLAAAQAFLSAVDWGDGWVIKADGLALGKGVVVCESREQALATVQDFLEGGAMGASGKTVVVEERLLGREVSAFSICDGTRAVFLGFACDYKRLEDGDRGPNTGGMGAFSPADWLPEGTAARVQEEVNLPLLRALKKRGTPYKGILFSGLMITKDGPKVIEFNARLGDPETQVLLPLLDEDLLPWLQAAQRGALQELPATGPRLKALAGVHVVTAAAGYPGTGGAVVRKGDAIHLPEALLPREGAPLEQKLFFAGVAKNEKGFVTNGGRVLGVTALAATRAEAREKAYALTRGIEIAGAQRRGDVGR